MCDAIARGDRAGMSSWMWLCCCGSERDLAPGPTEAQVPLSKREDLLSPSYGRLQGLNFHFTV